MRTPARYRHQPYAALAHRPFRRFVVSLLSMTMAAQLQAVVIAWYVFRLTRDPLVLGLLGLAEVVPYVSVALVAGYVVDRHDRRTVSAVALGVLLTAASLLYATMLDGGPRSVWPFYAVLGVCGIARSFLQTSRSALVAEIVPPEVFANATTWRSSTWQLGTVLGPALGGLLLGRFGERVASAVNVVLVAVALPTMLAVRHKPTLLVAPGSLRRTVAEGLRFIRGQQVILGSLTLDLLAVFFGGAVALLPAFASDVLRAGPEGYGILQSAPGVGAVLMALLLAHRRPFRHAGRALLSAVTVFGLAIVFFALSRSFLLSVVLLALSGAADNVSAVIRSTLIQVMVPPHLLGRVSAVNAIFVGSSNELGAFESGVTARMMGVVPAVVFGGAMTVATVALVAWRAPAVRRLGDISRLTPA